MKVKILCPLRHERLLCANELTRDPTDPRKLLHIQQAPFIIRQSLGNWS